MSDEKGVSLTEEEKANGMTSKIVPTKQARKLTPEEAAQRNPEDVKPRYTVNAGTKETSKQASIEKHGKQPVKLTAEEAEKATAAEVKAEVEAKGHRATKIDVAELPVVKFPTKIRMKDTSFDGQVGNIQFDDGISDVWHTAGQVYRVAAAGFEIYDRFTGVRINPAAENLEFTVENRFWMYGQEIPEDILNQRLPDVEYDGG